MNIFKILANGHGTVSETNVSAFLGYLLDPNANHSLGYEFLRLFLEKLDIEEHFNPEEYDFQIFYEQEFKSDRLNKSETVDICILCYKTETSGKSKSKMFDFIKNPKTLYKVFLIENKINAKSKTANQVVNQFNSFKHQLEKELEQNINDIYSIYITPEDDNYDNEFENISDEIENKSHLVWNSEKDRISIKSLLELLMKKENNFKIEPFNDYTKSTLKAFIQFIDADFKSEKQIEKDKKRRTDGVFTQDELTLNKKSNIEKKLTDLKKEILKRNSNLNISEPDISRPKEPRLKIYYREIVITLYAGYKKRDKIKIVFHVDHSIEKSFETLKKFSSNLNIKLNKEKYRNDAYCFTKEMDKKHEINNFEDIYNAILDAKALIDQNL